MNSDIRMYSELDSSCDICGFAIAHVDDLLYTGPIGFLALTKEAISQFRVGEVDAVTQEKGITFTGHEVQKGRNNSFAIPPEHMMRRSP